MLKIPKGRILILLQFLLINLMVFSQTADKTIDLNQQAQKIFDELVVEFNPTFHAPVQKR
jgi:hypothetical protein